MENVTNEQILEALGNLSVLELIALTKQLEEKWGVKAVPQVTETVSVVDTKPAVEQTEFNVVLLSVPADKKIAVIKVVKELTGLALKESKELVDAAPKAVKESVSKAEATEVKEKLTAAGAVVELK